MTRFDDALTRLHAEADAWFAADAIFRPASGAPVACKAERLLPEAAFGLDHARAVAGDAVFKVLKSALPKRPAKGDTFSLAGETWRAIESASIEDDDGLRYNVKVERA